MTLSMARLKLVQAGVARVQAGRQGRTRFPITPDILLALRWGWVNKPPHEMALFWAVATLAFFGFFRLGELLMSSAAQFDPAIHLAWRDISVVRDSDRPSALRIHLKRLKCDQLRRGVDVFVCVTGGCLCPVMAMGSYLMFCGASDGPFFRLPSGQPLLKSAFVEAVRAALSAAGFPSS